MKHKTPIYWEDVYPLFQIVVFFLILIGVPYILSILTYSQNYYTGLLSGYITFTFELSLFHGSLHKILQKIEERAI